MRTCFFVQGGDCADASSMTPVTAHDHYVTLLLCKHSTMPSWNVIERLKFYY